MKRPSEITDRSLVISAWAVAAMTSALVLLSPDHALAQCSLCRDAVAASSSETREAMTYAIMGLALTPYGVAGIAAWALSPAVRAAVRTFVRARLRWLKLGNPGDPL